MICCCTAPDAETGVVAEIAVEVGVPNFFPSGERKLQGTMEEPVNLASSSAHAEGCFYDLTIDKRGMGLGLEVDVTPIGVLINRIGSGTLRLHNSSAPEAITVALKNLIVMANGVTDPQAMVQTLADSETVTVRIARLERRTVRVERSSAKLGLTLLFFKKSSCLFISDITEGAVMQRNTAAAPKDAICPKDFIESVNGVLGSARDMLHELQSARTSEIVLLRMPAS